MVLRKFLKVSRHLYDIYSIKNYKTYFIDKMCQLSIKK